MWELGLFKPLKNDFDLTLLSLLPQSVDAPNDYFGTELRPTDFVQTTYDDSGHWLSKIPIPLALLRYHQLMATAKKIAGDFDLVISTHNEMDFGRPGIQYIHFPWSWMPRPDIDLKWYHGSGVLLKAYYAFAKRLSGFSREAVRQNLSLCNSDFIAQRMAELYNMPTEALFPPAPGDFPTIDWPNKKTGFVSIGRISPEKNLLRSIRILEKVRETSEDFDYLIIGTPDAPEYTQKIRSLAKQKDWIQLHFNVSRETLVKLACEQRFGLHGMDEEHYGMAVAELLQAGCVPFAPMSGGQMEILGNIEELCYQSESDAVQKILTVLRKESLQQDLLNRLAARKAHCSTQAFVDGMRNAVDRCLDQTNNNHSFSGETR